MDLIDLPEMEVYPFPHCVVRNALPQALYDDLWANYPEDAIFRHGTSAYGKQRTENQRVQVNAAHADVLPDNWQAFVEAYTSPEWWQRVCAWLGDMARFYYPALEPSLGPMEKWSAGPRIGHKTGDFKFDMNLDCQPAINTPQLSVGRVCGPHLDNPCELFAGLLYFGSGEGDLELYRLAQAPTFHGKLEVHEDGLERVKTIKYEPNVFVLLMNTPVSIHGVTPRGPTDKCRRLVNIIGEVPGRIYEVGHGRY